MKATELRIGNLLEYEYQTVSVDIISKSGFSVSGDEIYPVEENMDEVKPIPLTEEWLTKFGWVWNKECNSYEKFPDGDMRMNLSYRDTNNSYTMFHWITKGLVAERIHYVHQLQNLYFALTGKELELKS
jgi:hypothetical protein